MRTEKPVKSVRDRELIESVHYAQQRERLSANSFNYFIRDYLLTRYWMLLPSISE